MRNKLRVRNIGLRKLQFTQAPPNNRLDSFLDFRAGQFSHSISWGAFKTTDIDTIYFRRSGIFRRDLRCSFPRSHIFQTRSAMFVSMRWKKNSPPSNTTPTPTADAAIAIPGGCPCPVSAHRNPSITPAIGFNPYSQRHRAGTSELGYATGDASIQNCTTNGITARTSR